MLAHAEEPKLHNSYRFLNCFIVYQATQDAFHIKHFLKTIENDIAPCAIKSRTIKLVDSNHASHFQETVSLVLFFRRFAHGVQSQFSLHLYS